MQNAYFPIIFDLGKKEPDLQPDEPTALASLTEQDWQLLAEQSQLVTYQQGDVILEKGVASDKIYIIENGQVCIERKAGDVIARRGRGAVFGEISFVEGKGTSANVVADGTVEVSVIEKAHVEAALATNPELAIRFYKTLAITLAFRLRQAAERLNELS